MLEFIKNNAGKIKRNLISLDNQPIGKAALTVIFLLDIFILISIFNGLADHTKQLATPSQLIPQYCRDIVIEGNWNQTNRLDRLAQQISITKGSYYRRDKRERTRERHLVCKPISNLFFSIEDDKNLSKELIEYQRVQREIRQLNAELERTKNSYDTSLLEKMVDQEKEQTDISSIRNDIARKTTAIEKLVIKRKSLESSLLQNSEISKLFSMLDGFTEDDRISLRDDLRKLNYFYPVKRLGMEFLFLVPLFLIFYFWNIKSLRANRPFQALVSTHLLVVTFLPALFKILELIYDILPEKLLKHIFDILESLNLVALWHYFFMGVSILAALALLYVFQKKLFSKEKLIEKRISKGACQNCGKRLPPSIDVCPFCGFKQFKVCTHCNKPTYFHGKFCTHCGHEE